jgi:outer membrane biosynthesis protein TonB
VQFVVDENGEAQMSTFKVIKSSDPAFTEAVKRSVSASTFFPAEVEGRKVRQLVQLPYKFSYRR